MESTKVDREANVAKATGLLLDEAGNGFVADVEITRFAGSAREVVPDIRSMAVPREDFLAGLAAAAGYLRSLRDGGRELWPPDEGLRVSVRRRDKEPLECVGGQSLSALVATLGEALLRGTPLDVNSTITAALRKDDGGGWYTGHVEGVSEKVRAAADARMRLVIVAPANFTEATETIRHMADAGRADPSHDVGRALPRILECQSPARACDLMSEEAGELVRYLRKVEAEAIDPSEHSLIDRRMRPTFFDTLYQQQRVRYQQPGRRPNETSRSAQHRERPVEYQVMTEPWDEWFGRPENRRALILGESGQGKSTLVRREVWRAARQARKQLESGEKGVSEVAVPFYFRCRDLHESGDTCLEAMLTALQRHFNVSAQDLPLGELLTSDRALVIWDALDEAQGRQRLAERMMEFARLYPAPKVLLTCRPRLLPFFDWPAQPGAGHRLHLAPFDLKTATDFIEKWAQQRGLWGRGAELATRLRRSGGGAELVTTPLFACFLCITYLDESAELPDSLRANDLLYRCARSLDARWEATKTEEARQLDPSEREELYEDIAEHFARRGQFGGFAENDLLAHLTALRRKDPRRQRLSAEQLRDELPLLVRSQAAKDPQWGFSLRLFQEYYVARALADSDDPFAEIRPRLHHPEWRQVITLIAGVVREPDKAARYIEAIRTAGSEYEEVVSRDMLLAWECWCERPAAELVARPEAPDMLARICEYSERAEGERSESLAAQVRDRGQSLGLHVLCHCAGQCGNADQILATLLIPGARKDAADGSQYWPDLGETEFDLLLQAPDPAARAALVACLPAIVGPWLLPEAVEALSRDPEPAIRGALCQCLANAGLSVALAPQEALNLIRHLLKDPSPAVCLAAMELLTQLLCPDLGEANPNPDLFDTYQDVHALLRRPEPEVSAAAAQIWFEDWYGPRNPCELPWAFHLLSHPLPSARETAARALVSIVEQSPECLEAGIWEALEHLLVDGETAVRLEAARAVVSLGRLLEQHWQEGSPPGVPSRAEVLDRAILSMRELLHDPDPSIVASAADALGKLGPVAAEALPDLAAALGGPMEDEIKTRLLDLGWPCDLMYRDEFMPPHVVLLATVAPELSGALPGIWLLACSSDGKTRWAFWHVLARLQLPIRSADREVEGMLRLGNGDTLAAIEVLRNLEDSTWGLAQEAAELAQAPDLIIRQRGAWLLNVVSRTAEFQQWADIWSDPELVPPEDATQIDEDGWLAGSPVSVLLGLLADPDEKVRRFALESVQRLQWQLSEIPRHLAQLLAVAEGDELEKAINALAGLCAPTVVVRTLLPLVGSTWASRWILAKHPADLIAATADVAQAMMSGDQESQVVLLRVLESANLSGLQVPPDAVPDVLAMLRHSEAHVVQAGLLLLQHVQYLPQEAIKALIPLVEGECEGRDLGPATKLLVRNAPERALQCAPLVEDLHRMALGSVGGELAEFIGLLSLYDDSFDDDLLRLLANRDYCTRSSLLKGLDSAPSEAIEPDQILRERREMILSLAEGPSSLETLRKDLRTDDPRGCEQALVEARRLRPQLRRELVSDLVPFLRHSHPRIRAAAVIALSALPELTSARLKLMEELPHPGFRRGELLSAPTDLWTDTAELLAPLLHDVDEQVRQEAAKAIALGWSGEDGFEVFRSVVAGPDDGLAELATRYFAASRSDAPEWYARARLLLHSAEARCLEAFAWAWMMPAAYHQELLHDAQELTTHPSPLCRRAGLTILARVTVGVADAAEPPGLCACLEDPDPEIRSLAVEAVFNTAGVRPPGPTRKALTLLLDPDQRVRAAVADKLEYARDLTADLLPLLSEVVDEGDPEAQLAALKAIARLGCGAAEFASEAPQLVPQLCRLLVGGPEEWQVLALEVLQRLGDAALEAADTVYGLLNGTHGTGVVKTAAKVLLGWSMGALEPILSEARRCGRLAETAESLLSSGVLKPGWYVDFLKEQAAFADRQVWGQLERLAADQRSSVAHQALVALVAHGRLIQAPQHVLEGLVAKIAHAVEQSDYPDEFKYFDEHDRQDKLVGHFVDPEGRKWPTYRTWEERYEEMDPWERREVDEWERDRENGYEERELCEMKRFGSLWSTSADASEVLGALGGAAESALPKLAQIAQSSDASRASALARNAMHGILGALEAERSANLP